MTEVVLGMKITADGRVAVGEIDKVDGKFVQLGKTGKLTAEQLKKLSDAGSGLAPAFAPVPKVVDDTSKAFDRNAISAKQMAFAMRGVPAQFTDIFTSLQAGQNPMQVMLQQGGQLKDMFGGIGPAARALGGYVLGLVNPYTVAAAAAGGLVIAYESGRRESEAMAKAIIMSGNAAGATVGQMAGLSVSIATATGASRGAAAEAITLATSTGNITAANLERVATAAINMDRIAGVAVEDTIKQFSALGQAPVAASLKLNETTGFLTASVYLQIKALEDQGKILEAGTLAQDSWADVIDKRTPAMQANLGALEKSWIGVKDVAKGAWDAMLDVGREGSIEVQLARVNALLIAAAKDGNQIRIKALAAEAAALQQQIAEGAPGSEAADKAAQEQLKATVAWQAESDKLRSTAQIREAEIVRIRNVGLAAGKSELEIEKLIAAAKDKYKDKAAPVGAGDTPLDSLTNQAQKYAVELEAAAHQGRELTAMEKFAAAASQELTAAQYAQIESILKSNIAQEASNAATKAAADADKKWLATEAQSIESLQKAITAQDLHNASIGKSAEQIELAKRAAEDLLIVKDEERLADILKATSDESLSEVQLKKIDLLKQEIALRKELAGKLTAGAGLEASAKIAKDQQKAWDKFADDIERSLTDSLMRGFESGKGFGKSFVDSLKNTLKTAALKVVVQAMVDPIMGGVRGMFGGGSVGAGGSASGGGSLFSTLSGASNVWSGASNLGSGIASFGNWAGSPIISSFGSAMAAPSLANASYASLAADGLGGYAVGSSAAGTASTAASLGSTIGAAMPYVAAALIAYQLLSKPGGGPKTEGNYSDFSGAQMPGYGQGGALTGMAKQLTEGVEATYRDTIALFGKTPGDLTGGAFISTDPQGTANTQLAQTTFLNGQQVYNRVNMFGGSENVGRSDAELQSALAQSSGIAILSALEATQGLPKMVEEYLDAIDRTKLTAESAAAAINDVKLYDQIIDFAKDINLPLDNLNNAAIKAAGGLGNVAQSLSAVAAMQRQFTDFRHQLDLGDLSTLDPLSKYREARDLYTKAIQGTDSAAVMSSANDFLQASRTAFSSSGAYAADYETVTNSLNSFQAAATRSALPWTATDTPGTSATATNTAATVAVLQDGLLKLIEQLKLQGESLDEIASTLGLQASNPNLRKAA